MPRCSLFPVLYRSKLVFFFQKISNPPPPCWIYQSVAQFSSPYERTRAFRVDFSVSVEIAGGLEGLRYLFTKMNEIFAIIFVIWQSSLIMTKAMLKKTKQNKTRRTGNKYGSNLITTKKIVNWILSLPEFLLWIIDVSTNLTKMCGKETQ